MLINPPAETTIQCNHLPEHPQPSKGSTLQSYLQDLLTDASHTHTDTNGNVNLYKTINAVLLHLIKSEAHFQKHLQEINVHLELIEVNQLTTHPTSPNYTSTAANPKALLKLPTKKDMLLARQGKTITHSKVKSQPLKEADCTQLVQKKNKVLNKMDAMLQGKNVAFKAVRILPSSDMTFFSRNLIHKDRLNKNKHKWSKQLHPDLAATPSTNAVLALGILAKFDM